MNVKPGKRSVSVLESVAMTDIVMNLFIFFFISFSLLYTFNPTKESKVEVNLPKTKSKETPSKDTALKVSINAKNEIYLSGKKVDLASLSEQLRQQKKQKAALLVRADKSASVDTLVRVLDTAKDAGITQLGVASEKSS